ncbi:U-box domain-containing protein 44-like [Prosopis cineraria]|uniref:U-box domain-containing protein 44-like n=1 Tax=Prosopis cineraria TaxID=364024 RepID=UPI00240F22D4|nr:U-box domain-containing protein 44-like [Prosopis cineraria]
MMATSEAVSHIINIIAELVVCASDVLMKKDSFKELAAYLESIVPILKELMTKKVSNSEAFINTIDVLNREIRDAKQLTLECRQRSKVYLLVNCMSINKRLQKTIREISWAIGLLPLATSDLSSRTIEEIGKLSENMQQAEFKATVAQEEILEKIESGILENNVDHSYADNLLIHIAEAVGATTERSTLKKELVEFKIEIENCRLRKDQEEAMYMDQIIALLERADAASSPRERELKYLSKRNSLGSQTLEPLQSFHCPITQEVMEDPVETSTGKTFERSAIEKWFAEGNKLCPLTMTPLDTSILRSNRILKQSIKEWKDRNTMITIVLTKEKLHSKDDDEVLHCLGTLQDLCEQSGQHREWLMLENYIPVLIQILGAKNHDVRNRALAILNILAKDNDDAKERIANIDNAVVSIVHSLGRRAGERKLAVALLLELSKYDLVREEIGKVQGCILLLVTMSSSDDNEAAGNAKELLENLSYSNNNVLKMARANYFQHLLHRLSTGPDDVKMIMATALAEMELTNLNKASLFEGGVLGPLLHLVSHADILVKTVAIRSLRNLSSLKKNGLEMIRQGAVRPIFDLLFQPGLLSLSLKEHITAVIMQLAASTISTDGQAPDLLLESDEDILKLFSLISFTRSDVQQNILQTFYALCQSPSASFIRNKLRQGSVFEVLVQLCEQENLNLRASAVKLFACLVCDEARILENVNQKCVEAMLQILRTSSDEEEISSALGIVRYLPKVHQITQWLLDAGALPIINNHLQDRKDKDCQKSKLLENAIGALSHFTVSTNLEWQKSAAEIGVISVLVQLLECGTTSTKQQAASSLAQFSKSSLELSRPVSKPKGLWCFSAPTRISCLVHGGMCTVKSSFCLVEADAVRPLVRTLGESDPGVSEASLDALLTLVEGERLQNGSKVLAVANAIPVIIKCLNSPSPGLQEKSLHALERIFRLWEFKQLYGASAHMPLVDLTQRGTDRVRSLAARVLAHLNVLHYQSSYF